MNNQTPAVQTPEAASGAWEILQRTSELLALWGLVVAQPLFDIISKNAEFLVVHKLGPLDLTILTLGIGLIFPVFMSGLELLAGLIFRPAAVWLHFAILATLAAVGFAQFFQTADLVPWLIAATAVAGGITVAILIKTWSVARNFCALLSPVAVVFPLLFLGSNQVRTLLISPLRESLNLSTTEKMPQVNSTTPVVFVLFDELPLASLLDATDRIDKNYFPMFANLAEEATWYRRATAVINSTADSVPSILTGSYPFEKKLPTLAGHPNNLFTWVGSTYRTNCFEPVTNMCPKNSRLDSASERNRIERMVGVAQDLWLVYQHLILPVRWAERLPSISTTWHNFGGHVAHRSKKDKSAEHRYWGDVTSTTRQFVSDLEPSSQPTLHFMHLLLPHLPWKYLPSGKEYGPVNADLFPYGLHQERWSDDEWATLQGLQRHLLQLVYADKVLGMIVDQMKTSGLWKDSFFIVTADHGAAFWPDGLRRGISDRNVWEILRVPLLIKFPGQKQGEIVDRSVELVDILPTIADALGTDLPWSVDGRSLTDSSAADRNTHSMFRVRGDKTRSRRQLPFHLDGLQAAVTRKIQRFGAGLFDFGPRPELLGRNATDLVTTESTHLAQVRLMDEQSFDSVDLNSNYLPARILGEIRETTASVAPEVAISVNGRIRATTRTQVSMKNQDSGARRFMAMVPEISFRQGRNRVEIFEIAEGVSGVHLKATSQISATRYRLVTSQKGQVESIERSDGQQYQVGGGSLTGTVIFDSTQFKGWAANIETRKPADSLLLFKDGEFITQIRLNTTSMAKRYENPEVPNSGFAVIVPYAAIGTPDAERLAFYATLDEVADRLAFKESFKQ